MLAAPIAACLINLMNRKGRRRRCRCHMQLQLATASAIDSSNIAITAAQSKLWTGRNCRSYRSIYAQLNAAIFLFPPLCIISFPLIGKRTLALGCADCNAPARLNLHFDFNQLNLRLRLGWLLISSASLLLSFSCFVHCAGLSLVH